MKFKANVSDFATTNPIVDFEKESKFHIRLNPNITYIPLFHLTRGERLIDLVQDAELSIMNHMFTYNEYISNISTYGRIVDNSYQALKIHLDKYKFSKIQFINHLIAKHSHQKRNIMDAIHRCTSVKPDISIATLEFINTCARKAIAKTYINADTKGLYFSTYKEEKVYYYVLPYAVFTTREALLNIRTPIQQDPCHIPDTLQYILTLHRDYAFVGKSLDGCLDSKHYKMFVRQDLISENTTNPHLRNYFNKIVVPFCKDNEIEIIVAPDLTKMYHRAIEKPKSLKDTNILVDQAVKRFEECLPILSL